MVSFRDRDPGTEVGRCAVVASRTGDGGALPVSIACDVT